MARNYDSHAITSALNLPRPFDTYAPRTQRRYLKAYREGVTREQTLRRERAQRRSQPAARARKAAAALRKMRVGNADIGSHDRDTIDELGEDLGWDETADMLEAQLEAAQEYRDTRDSNKGRAGWARREEHSDKHFGDLTPYYYYHATA